MRWKRPLFLLHRWAGIVLCLFFALWFASGFFMMYVPFPQLTAMERLAGTHPLDFSTARLSPADVLAVLRSDDFNTLATPDAIRTITSTEHSAHISVRAIRLAMMLGRPAYIVHPNNDAQPRLILADTGEVLREITPAIGKTIAQDFIHRAVLSVPTDHVTYDATLITDQWTVSSSLNDHRPLLRYQLNDAQGTELYVSARTGEVVVDTQRRERLLNYVGAVTHWLYPTFIRKHQSVWKWIVDILASAGVILGISGLWIGLIRWKRKRQPGKPSVPYRGLMRWHYFFGISFGLCALTWVLSGLLSMNPLSLNPSTRPDRDQYVVLTGKQLTPVDFHLPTDGFGVNAMQAELIHYAGQPLYRVVDRDSHVHLVAGHASPVEYPRIDTLKERAPLLMPAAVVSNMRLLKSYDDYYYTRHPERTQKPLPILRVQFNDTKSTWFHIDTTTGQLIERSTRINRLYRWLYNGLHSWDIRWLWEHRPLWDICVITFLLGGLTLSLLGVTIGIQRIRGIHPVRKPKPAFSQVPVNSCARVDQQ